MSYIITTSIKDVIRKKPIVYYRYTNTVLSRMSTYRLTGNYQNKGEAFHDITLENISLCIVVVEISTNVEKELTVPIVFYTTASFF